MTATTNLAKLIENTIRADVRAVGSYFVPDSIGYVKLDAMENPYQLPDDLRAELGARRSRTPSAQSWASRPGTTFCSAMARMS
jgi:hypothetical protein